MDSDKTMKIVTNLDRSGVEGLLGEIRAQAAAKNLPDKPQHAGISAQLEMAELNLKNL